MSPKTKNFFYETEREAHLREALDDAARWDTGCEADRVRNEFVIPVAVKVFNALRPRSILDVGAATGFTARSINQKLKYRPNWHLLDRDANRLAFAKARCPSEMQVQTIHDNFLNRSPLGQKFDALFFGFTLLELGMGSEVLQGIDRLCSDRGIVVIAQPDVMQDVLADSERDPTLIAQFASGPVSLRKTDKFTGAEYPFHAERFEFITYKVMHLGFSLARFEREVFDGRSVYLLAFARRD